MNDHELVVFLQWCLPKIQLRWPGFRKVRNTIRKRLNRRIRELSLVDLNAYREKLNSDPSEWKVLKAMCRITISRFYRDPHVFDKLEKHLIPDRIENAVINRRDKISVLSVGSASGEEPYSISLIWNFLAGPEFPGMNIEIFAFDVDEVVVGSARIGCYSESTLKHLPDILVNKGFRKANDCYCLHREIKNAVQFNVQDLEIFETDRKFDIIFCRNLAFTYFDTSTQNVVLSTLTNALRPGGYLIIGAHESLPAEDSLLQNIYNGVPIYQLADH